MNGYIKLARSLLENPIFQNEKLLKVWIWCLAKATHKEHIQLVGLQKIKLQPGQFITGRKVGAQELKMKPSTFWGYMCWLNDNKSLDIKSDNKKSLVTLVNWEQYQVKGDNIDSKIDSCPTAGRPLADTNNNGNKGNKDISTNVDISTPFDQFWSAYPEGGYQNSKPQAQKNFTSLIKKVSADRIIQAAKNYATDCTTLGKTEFLYKASNFVGRAEYYKAYLPEVWTPAKPPKQQQPTPAQWHPRQPVYKFREDCDRCRGTGVWRFTVDGEDKQGRCTCGRLIE